MRCNCPAKTGRYFMHGPKLLYPSEADRPFYEGRTRLRATLGDSVGLLVHRKKAASECSQPSIRNYLCNEVAIEAF